MKKQLAFMIAPVIAVAISSSASADLIYDNDGPNGVNGYSNISTPGIERKIADDFTIAGGAGWIANQVQMSYIWTSGTFDHASEFLVEFFADDAGGGPGTLLSAQVSSSFTETATGDFYFNRPEVLMLVDIAEVGLDADTNYWVSIQPTGTENGFQMTSHADANIVGQEAYVNFEELGGTWLPGSNPEVFGVAADVSFQIFGYEVPAPGALALLGFAGLVGVRRRRN